MTKQKIINLSEERLNAITDEALCYLKMEKAITYYRDYMQECPLSESDFDELYPCEKATLVTKYCDFDYFKQSKQDKISDIVMLFDNGDVDVFMEE